MDEDHRAVLAAIPTDFLDLTDIPKTRALFDETRREMRSGTVPDGMTIEDHHAPGPEGAPEVLVRVYRPAGAEAAAPALFWIHGGGMVLGRVEHDDDLCAARAQRLGAIVASVEYRLAPEHPFPAPVEDCYAGLRWLRRNADALGVDPARIAIGGASAGGGLAAGCALLARDRGEVALCFQFLVYPMLDDRNETQSSFAITDPRLWSREANQLGWNAYLAGRAGSAEVSPYAAPARAQNLAGLPPAYINVGELDLFLDEDIAYAQALMRAGVPAELHVYPGAFHGSNMFVSRSALSKRWRKDEWAALERALGSAAAPR
ncbi:MAG: alpha/beta hydrolase [Myxococcales bacterium]|nr:alpha/beta hydrolase [Myxococcales bacterium]